MRGGGRGGEASQRAARGQAPAGTRRTRATEGTWANRGGKAQSGAGTTIGRGT